jgi:hypothetical protein
MLIGFLGLAFGIFLIRSSNKDYKLEIELANRCTERDKAKIKFIGVELRQGASTHNYAFMILDFNGVEKRFSSIVDEIRIKYHKEVFFPIFYNPNNPEEYVYDNITYSEDV